MHANAITKTWNNEHNPYFIVKLWHMITKRCAFTKMFTDTFEMNSKSFWS